MRLKEILELPDLMLNACHKKQLDHVCDHFNITGISQDSRQVKPGFLFAALPGTTLDGRCFIEDAIHNGAKAILAPLNTQYPDIVEQQNVPTIESLNIAQDLALISKYFYKDKPEHLYAVTGTNGKTSVVQFLAQLLNLKNKKAASLGTMGLKIEKETHDTGMTTLGSVDLYALLKQAHDAHITDLALEASSHGLDQDRLHGLSFKTAGFTNITQDHLDYHETMDNYFEAKKRLFIDLLDENGTAVINADSDYSDQLITSCKQTNKKVQTYGYAGETIKIISQTAMDNGQILTLEMNGNTHEIKLPLMGFFQGMNALCAFLMAEFTEEDLPLLSKLEAIEGRMQWVGKTSKGMNVYIDYAHTPDAIETALKSARHHTKNNLWCLFGCGGNRDINKRPLMGKAAHEYADHVILTDDNPRFENPELIRTHAKQGCPEAVEIGDRRQAIAYGLEMGEADDLFIICGKGHENGQIIEGIKHPFHDGETVKNLLTANN